MAGMLIYTEEWKAGYKVRNSFPRAGLSFHLTRAHAHTYTHITHATHTRTHDATRATMYKSLGHPIDPLPCTCMRAHDTHTRTHAYLLHIRRNPEISRFLKLFRKMC